MKRIAVLFTLLIIAIVILADLGRLPHFIRFFTGLPYGDKLGHFVLFGLLDFFITRAALSAFANRNPIMVALSAGLMLALFVAAEEYSQNYFSERTADWVDLFTSYAGMFIGAAGAFKLRARG